tara:strand:- start:126 stop:1460 length:1335 start_codon:yes stop_codon:yes gene_type:complete
MSNYTITTDFGAKDSLPSSNDSKVVRGSEFTTEFTNIQTAIATKADTAGDTFTGVVNFSADVAVNTNTLFVDVSEAKVGIGTTTPSTELDVSGDVSIRGTFPTLFFSDTDSDPDYYISAGNGYFRIFDNTNSADRFHIDSSGKVGIGTTTPSEKLQVNGNIKIGDSHIIGDDGFDNLTLISSSPEGIVYGSNTDHIFKTGATGLDATGTERMRIDSSGNVLVGTTETDIGYTDSGAGFSVSPLGFAQIARSSDASLLYLNKLDNDGDIILFEKDGLGVGSIGSRGGAALFIESAGSTGKAGLDIDVVIAPRKDGALSDGQIDLGTSAYRFQDLYRSGSTYSTSDRNKKQDIRDLTDAEARVATVAKGSLKAFRYIDSVEAEGDEANIHFGIIAQDLKAAFEAEGLNANDYQVFKTSTYTDDDGVEQTTYSICYENLLAFIIAAI